MSISFSNFTCPGGLYIEQGEVESRDKGNMWVYLYYIFAEYKFNILVTNSSGVLASGTGQLSIYSQYLSFLISVYSSNGKPQVEITDLAMSLQLSLYSSLQYEQISDLQSYLNNNQETVQALVIQEVYKGIDKMNGELLNAPSLVPLAFWNMWIDFSLTGNSTTENGYVVVPMKGNVLSATKGEVYPFPPNRMSEMSGSNDLQMQIANMPLQIMANVIWSQFSGKIEKLPEEMQMQLNTTALKSIFPKIFSKYGGNKSVYLQVSSSGVWPQIVLKTHSSVTVIIGVLTQFYVQTTASYVHAIDVNSLLEVNFNFTMQNSVVSMAVNFVKALDNVVGYTTVGRMNEKNINTELGRIITQSVPAINSVLKSVVAQVPTIECEFFTVESISVQNGEVLVGANFKS